MAEITDFFGKSSVDNDYAVATTVESNRTAGDAVLEAIDLSKFTEDTPVFFITYKKVTDPLTEEVSVIDLVSWKGLVNGGANTITNLTPAPGYSDIGNTAGDFIELIPTSYWGNQLVDGILEEHNPDGTHNDTKVVKTTGAQTVAGVKTFSDKPVVPDESFPAAKIDFDTAGVAIFMETDFSITFTPPWDCIIEVEAMRGATWGFAGNPTSLTVNNISGLTTMANFVGGLTLGDTVGRHMSAKRIFTGGQGGTSYTATATQANAAGSGNSAMVVKCYPVNGS